MSLGDLKADGRAEVSMHTDKHKKEGERGILDSRGSAGAMSAVPVSRRQSRGYSPLDRHAKFKAKSSSTGRIDRLATATGRRKVGLIAR